MVKGKVKKKEWYAGQVHENAKPFRETIQSFCEEYGAALDIEKEGVTAWEIRIVCEEKCGVLYIYEESVVDTAPVCDQCRIIGWQQHPVCTKRYHFIIPKEGAPVISNARIPEVEAAAKGDDDHFTQPQSEFDSSQHVLHGLIHVNGFGHLLRINGREGGSAVFSGRQLMQVWDKLCSSLNTRKISIEDVSSKSGMELRVLHAAAYLHTWYGKWGYDVGRGPFNISKKTWKSTVALVHNTPMTAVLEDFNSCVFDPHIGQIIDRYQVHIPEEPDPVTLGLFLRRMLFLLRNPSVAAGILGVEEGKSQKGPAVWPPTVTRRPRTPKIKFRAEEAMEDDLGNSEVLKEIQSPKPPQSLKRQRENAIEEDLRGTRRRKASVKRWSPEASAELHDIIEPKHAEPTPEAPILEESQILLQICPDQLCPLDLSRKHHALKAEALQQAVEFLIALLKANAEKCIPEESLAFILRQRGFTLPVIRATLQITANATTLEHAIYRQDVTKDGRTVACYAIDSLPSIEKVAPRVLSQLPSLPQVDGAQEQAWEGSLSIPSLNDHGEHGKAHPQVSTSETNNAGVIHPDQHHIAPAKEEATEPPSKNVAAAHDMSAESRQSVLETIQCEGTQPAFLGCQAEDTGDPDSGGAASVQPSNGVLSLQGSLSEEQLYTSLHGMKAPVACPKAGALSKTPLTYGIKADGTSLRDLVPPIVQQIPVSLDAPSAELPTAQPVTSKESMLSIDEQRGEAEIEEQIDAAADLGDSPLGLPATIPCQEQNNMPGLSNALLDIVEEQHTLCSSESQREQSSRPNEVHVEDGGGLDLAEPQETSTPSNCALQQPSDTIAQPHQGPTQVAPLRNAIDEPLDDTPLWPWGSRKGRSKRQRTLSRQPSPSSIPRKAISEQPTLPAIEHCLTFSDGSTQAAPLRLLVVNQQNQQLQSHFNGSAPAGRHAGIIQPVRQDFQHGPLEDTVLPSANVGRSSPQPDAPTFDHIAELGPKQNSPVKSPNLDQAEPLQCPEASTSHEPISDQNCNEDIVPCKVLPISTAQDDSLNQNLVSLAAKDVIDGTAQNDHSKTGAPGKIPLLKDATKSGRSGRQKGGSRLRDSSIQRRKTSTLQGKDQAIINALSRVEPAWTRLKPGAPFSAQASAQPSDQVLCDLKHFFTCVMICYHPAYAAGMVPAALEPAPNTVLVQPTPHAQQLAVTANRRRSPGLQAPRLLEHVALLRDVKHFIKDYTCLSGVNSKKLPLLLVQISAMDFVSADNSVSKLQRPSKALSGPKPAVKMIKRRRIVQPPPELISLQPRMTAKQIIAAAEAAFRSSYVMLANYQLKAIESLPKTKAAVQVLKVLKLGSILQAEGRQETADADPQWHHSGGEEDWCVTCKCGCRDDDGERMIACDKCGLWMHLRCQDIPASAPIPESFLCQRCKSTT